MKSFSQFSQGMKLQYYAGACNASQVELLLAKDPTFDIYSSGVTNSPIMVAIDRYITANNNVATDPNQKTCGECLRTIIAIMKDKRYNFKELPNRDKTDLMYLLMKGKSVTDASLQLSGYTILLGTVLTELKQKAGFDINYTLPTYMNTAPGNAIGAVSFSGLATSYCYLLQEFPDLAKNLDKRGSTKSYTPLMLAVLGNNQPMVTALASTGADYYLEVDGFSVFPPDELAKSLGFTAISTYLNSRRLGSSPASAPWCR